ncbi:M10 family metallopeptidase C-terminal domain-containing protein [Oscillatoria sp. FACHB-1407]|uniref:M10 family metallopeptidase C-terminal domain-containing protein n=1 Tax=Oscillatoria sp. FACHB-1407 TaxID=2692847 RepID=UPI0016845511|nr:M10 family metallopeptidase C-terminal domain-containing protein [Oscillatoria sp. FACHB-1407]MBD2460549.1 M10 family metallopeptidase C-terminal domain-containing protein [Oscillatoria sp. FACHB-1407]
MQSTSLSFDNSIANSSLNADNFLTQRSGWTGSGLTPHRVAQRTTCICVQCANGSSFVPTSTGSTAITKPLEISWVNSSNLNYIDSLAFGTKWNTPTITYSFYNNALNGAYYADTKGLSEVSDTTKAFIRNILENYIEPFVNVDFVEVADTATSHGQVRYMLSNDADYAHAYFPYPGMNQSGDVHLDPDNDNNLTDDGWQTGPGSYGFETLIHETLHALGLKHPGDYNGNEQGSTGLGPFLPRWEDNNTNTVMTYSPSTHYAVSLMPYDIAALQYLYGASSLNAGNTVYSFDRVSGYSDGSRYWGSSTIDVKLALWDAGGVDTLDFSKLAADAKGYVLELTEGGMLTTKAAYDNMPFITPDDTSRTVYRTSAYGTAIADNSIIENVIGTSSADDIVGNAVANQIEGNGGNDWIAGDNGKDSLFGGDGRDELLGDNGNDILVGGNGGDIISGGRGSDIIWGGQVPVGQTSLGGRAKVVDSIIDTMTGGAGRDVFVLASGRQYDLIRDFQDGFDRLRLSAGISPSRVHAVQQGQNTLVKAGNDVLAILTGVQANRITAADIQFA